MAYKFLIGAAALALIAGGTVYAQIDIGAEADVEARVNHYDGVNIETKQEALDVFQDRNTRIETIMAKGDLDDTDLEAIHEISYALESAIDALIEMKAYPKENMEAVDEAVQALHHASENHEGAETRTWFTKLEERVAALNTDTGIETASITEANVKKESYTIVIKDHMFTPDEVRVPAGEKIKLIVDNQDPTPEEFESDDMRREKIIAGNSKATMYVGPLEPGKYHFFGEFNLDTANGYVIAE